MDYITSTNDDNLNLINKYNVQICVKTNVASRPPASLQRSYIEHMYIPNTRLVIREIYDQINRLKYLQTVTYGNKSKLKNALLLIIDGHRVSFVNISLNVSVHFIHIGISSSKYKYVCLCCLAS